MTPTHACRSITYSGLNGTLPSAYSALTRVATLAFHGNQLSGTLPGSWSTLTNVDAIYLLNNKLSGTLPPSWSALTRLREL
jgi:hypothetical protein